MSAIYPITLESLVEAYYDCRKNKRGKNECVRFTYNRERSLVELKEQIERGEYKIDCSNAFIVTYPTKREVFAASFRDRIIHHWIALRLEPLMDRYFIEDSYNCRKGKGTSYGIKRTQDILGYVTEDWKKDAYVLKWDFSGYFMSIDKNILWNMVDELIDAEYKENDVLTLKYLTKLTIYNEPQNNCKRTSPEIMWEGLAREKSLFTNEKNKGLPIGNLTSQLFANFYLWKVDIMMKERHIGYCRYVDDGWIIDNDKKKIFESLKLMKVELNKLGVKIHKKKFYFQRADKGIKVIGVVIKPHRIYIASRVISKCVQKIHHFNQSKVTKHNVIKVQQSINSYLGEMKQYAAYKYKKKILMMLDNKWFKHLTIENNHSKLKKDNMNFINTTSTDKKIVTRISGNYALHFGHVAVEGGYACVETILRFYPTYEDVCGIVDKYNSLYGTEYFISREEYNGNQANA